MKIGTIFIHLLVCCSLFAQQLKDPFYGKYTLGKSAELVTLWPQKGGTDCHLKVYDLTGSKIITGQTDISYTGSWALGGQKQMDVACGDFNSDGYDDIVAVWEGADNSLKMAIPQIQKGTLWWSQSHQVSFASNTIYSQPAALSPSTIRVLKGQFDLDSDDEFLLAYWGADEKICLTVYNSAADLTPTAAGSIADAKLDHALDANAVYDIACGDFNRDGIDEVILARNTLDNTTKHVVLSIYSYNTVTSQFTRQLSDTSVYATNWHLRHIDLVCGDFNNDGFSEAAISFMRWSYRWDRWSDFWGCHDDFYVTDCHNLYTLKIRADLKHIDLQQDEPLQPWCSEVKYLSRDCTNRTVYYVSPPTALTCADLNNDGRDELLYTCAGKVRIYQPGMDPGLETSFEIDIEDRNNDVSRRSIAVADLDAAIGADSTWYPEIIVSDWGANVMRRLRIFAPRITNGVLTGVDQIPNAATQFLDEFSLDGCAALAVGNFDGDGVKLGIPSHFRKTIVQPTTIINAPPLHYDIINDTPYDIADCYRDACDFWAEYSQVSSLHTEIQTELRSDWGVSASIGGGFSAMGFAIQAHLRASYGEGFSKTYFASTTITGQSSTTITFDDVIFASVNNYDIWEYPIYTDGELVNGEQVLAVVPSVEQASDQWYNSKNKGDIGKNYSPTHECGNILSYYPDEALFEIEGIGQMIYDRESFNLGSSWHDWSVNFENFSAETDLSYYQVAMEVGASISGYGVQVGVSGNYSRKGFVTATSSVYEGLNFYVSLGAVPAEAGYTVRPFLYWAENGALVLDYTVTPLTLTGEKTWWQQMYENAPDLSFILPWHYDFEKGMSLTNADRYRTRDICFEPSYCSAGDTINVSACLHNFSLKETATVADVRFYIGDPDENGIPIISLEGDSVFKTASNLYAREKSELKFRWKVPEDVPYYPKIYALIDPSDEISEVHEKNNKGFRILEVEGIVAVEKEIDPHLPATYNLEQNYPNPFNPSTKICYDLPRSDEVQLVVYNTLGQKVLTLVSGKQPAGSYQVEWNAGGYATGIYYYRLKCKNGFEKIKKLVLLK